MIFLLQCHLPLFFLSLLYVSRSPPLPSVISLNCTPPCQDDIVNNKFIGVFVDRLTYGVTKTKFITSTFNNGPDRLIGTMQCRPNLSSTTCRLCAQTAKETIFNQCLNAVAVTAWLDGCYLQYSYHHNCTMFSRARFNTNNYWSCSKQTILVDLVRFESALETLLLILRADIMKTVGHFSTGKIQYGNRSEVYGLAECLQNVSLNDCGVCVSKGIEKLSERCGGEGGGTVVAGHCVVRYESYEFFFSRVDPGRSLDGNNGSGAVRIWENNESSSGRKSFKVKVAVIWGIGMACFVVVVLSAWLLRRSIVNTAKVVTVLGVNDAGNGK